jgi:type 1 fimbria pilin
MHISSAVLFLSLGAALFAGAGSARAAEGRIAFSGAVVEPTCAVAPAIAPRGAAPHQFACRKTASSDGQAYSQEVMEVVSGDAYRDRLLDYFASYAPAAAKGGPAARLIVRTYE